MVANSAQSADPGKVELILSQLSTLPALAPVAIKLLQTTRQEDAEIAEIVRLIESDTSLAAQVVSAVRRANRGVRRESVTIERAVTLLGIQTLRQIVLTTKIIEVFDRQASGKDAVFCRAEFWKHCLAVACTAQWLAMRSSGQADPDNAFLAGLLHDIGKAAINACIPKSYERCVDECRRRRDELLSIEREILGTDHTVVGRRLADRWQLPAELTECIWLHHLPPDALPQDVSRPNLLRTVWLADTLVRANRLGLSGNFAPTPPASQAARQAGFDPSVCDEVIAALPAELEERAAWVGLDNLNAGRLYIDALSESARDLSAMTEQHRRQNQRLQRTAEFFKAVSTLNKRINAETGLIEVAAIAADAVARLFQRRAVTLYCRGEASQTLLLTSAGPELAPTMRIARDDENANLRHMEEQTAADLARAGAWISPVPPSVRQLVSADMHLLNRGALLLFPVLRDDHWVGGIALAGPREVLAAAAVESNELEVLSSAIALAIEYAASRAKAVRFAEGFAWSHQRLAAAQKELAQVAGVRMIAEMAAGAGHEINTPLAVISGRAQLLRDQISDGELKAQAEEIVQAAHRASQIITELMAFAEPGTPQPQDVALAAVLPPIIETLRQSPQTTRDFVLSIPADLPEIRCDPKHLSSALQELLANAVEATTPEAGRIEIKADADASDERVTIDVIDNGQGMDPDVRARAFDPFYSHRGAGRGRGLGLSRVWRWMQANDGRVLLDPAPEGTGTVARLRLPRATPAA